MNSSRDFDSQFSEKKIAILPWVGREYNNGVNGKKILVVGASKYCTNKNKEICHSKCSTYLPPEVRHRFCKYKRQEVVMNNRRDIPLSHYSTYRVFLELFTAVEYEEFWSHVAFMNLIQPYVPEKRTHANFNYHHEMHTYTQKVNDAISILKPDIIIMWGWEVSSIICDDIRLAKHDAFFDDESLFSKIISFAGVPSKTNDILSKAFAEVCSHKQSDKITPTISICKSLEHLCKKDKDIANKFLNVITDLDAVSVLKANQNETGIKNVDKPIVFVSVYHPSGGYSGMNKNISKQRLELAFHLANNLQGQV